MERAVTLIEDRSPRPSDVRPVVTGTVIDATALFRRPPQTLDLAVALTTLFAMFRDPADR